jgi:hypothetical protein
MMGGSGSAMAMNNTVNNNRKLLRNKAKEKFKNEGLISNASHPGFVFDETVYDEKVKNRLIEKMKLDKGKDRKIQIIALVASLLIFFILFLFFTNTQMKFK